MAPMSVPALPLLWGALAWAGPSPVGAWMDAVVLLEQGSTACAGVVIDAEGTVATAYHCVAAGGHPRVQRRDGTVARGRVRGVDRARDLALVAVDGLAGGPWLPVAQGAPELGAPLWALGHPGAADAPGGFYAGTLRFSAVQGIVSAVGPEALQISAPVNPGNSGGPVVDAEGRVIGIVSRRLGGQALGFAARAVHLTDLDPSTALSPFGGTVALEAAFVAFDSGTSGLSPRLELALRDQLVIEGSVTFPLSPRWSAARYDAVSFLRTEVHGGPRLRLGQGSWTLRLDGWAGMALTESVTTPPDVALPFETITRWGPVVGGAVRLRSVGFELGYGLDGGLTRAAVVLRLPGVVRVF